MKSIQPEPNGTRDEGDEVNLAVWQAMAADQVNRFEIRVREDRIVETLACAKTTGNSVPLPE